MKQLPFNACDYRCERCLETAECAVFQNLQKRAVMNNLSGRDGNDLDSVLEEIRDSFRETEKMIKQKARELGIDIDVIAGGSSAEEIREECKSTMEDDLYKQSHAFTMDTNQFLQGIEANAGEAKEYLDDIAWHHTIVTAKVFRALGWKAGDANAVDARNSAAVAMKSLTICIMAFDHLASLYPRMSADCGRLSAAGNQLKEKIKKRFKS